MRVICHIDRPEVIGYEDVFEDGDAWVKVQGCEACSVENRKTCCGSCPMFTAKGCFFHEEASNSKPYRCVVWPTPDASLSWCALEFKCVKGSKQGKVRRIKDKGNEFI
jgi:hypothetical protein